MHAIWIFYLKKKWPLAMHITDSRRVPPSPSPSQLHRHLEAPPFSVAINRGIAPATNPWGCPSHPRGSWGWIHSERVLSCVIEGPGSVLGGRDGTGGSGVHVHLDKVEGFAGDFFFSPPGGGGVNCALVCPICFFPRRILLF